MRGIKIFKGNNLNENGIIALSNLCTILNVRVSERAFQELRLNTDYPSLISLSAFLENLNISTLSVSLQVSQLREIPYPAIAHLSKNGGHFVVLQKLEENTLHYIDPDVGLIKEPINEFEIKWTGVVLLVEANERSGEEGYKERRTHEVFTQWSNYLVWILTTTFLITPFFFLHFTITPYYLLKIAGGIFCFMLLQKQFGSSSKALASFCRLGSNSNCDAVINSRASKLFGVIPLPEIGMLYFLGSLLSLAISSVSDLSVIGITCSLSILLIPFTLVSIYYQWKILKAWCPLCLLVMTIVWLEVLTSLPSLSQFTISTPSIVISFIGFSLPLVFWLAIRERFIDSYRIPNLERSLYRFSRSERVFQSLLSNHPEVDERTFTNEITAGNPTALTTITLVSNPTCGPCSAAHAAIEDLLDRFDDKIKVNFRFAVNPKDSDSLAGKMVRHLIALSLTEPQQCRRALSDWYLLGGRINLYEWIMKNPVSDNISEREQVNLLLAQHTNWCKQVGIVTTPALFINGKKLPEEYTLGDLKYQIRKIVESIPDREFETAN